MLGAIALRRGPSAAGEARAWLEEAMTVARELAMKPLEARTLAELGEAHLLAGRRNDAHANLAEAVGLLRSTAMHRWLGRRAPRDRCLSGANPAVQEAYLGVPDALATLAGRAREALDSSTLSDACGCRVEGSR